MKISPLKILYICTHNRCRSVLSEAISNQQGNCNGQQLLISKSAGSTPAGEVHPLTIKYLQKSGYSTNSLTSNSWDDEAYMNGFVPDVLITVCDNADGESCPMWLGNLPEMVRLHWGLADPSKNTEDDVETEHNFINCIKNIEARVADLLDIAKLPLSQRQHALITLKNSLSK